MDSSPQVLIILHMWTRKFRDSSDGSLVNDCQGREALMGICLCGSPISEPLIYPLVISHIMSPSRSKICHIPTILCSSLHTHDLSPTSQMHTSPGSEVSALRRRFGAGEAGEPAEGCAPTGCRPSGV